MTEAPQDRPAEFPFSGWDEEVIRAFEKLKGRPRHCGFNAIRGLRRAWAIAQIDPEMALFRAITAEEEAATALIFALQRRRYPGASLLDPRKHVHKAGWAPFLATVESIFAEFGFPAPQYRLKADAEPPRLDISLPTEAIGLEPGYLGTPEQPLQGLLTGGSGGGAARVLDFQAELQRRANDAGQRDVLALLRDAANLRNRLLYASDDGYVVVENPDPFLLRRRRAIIQLLTLTIAILQTPVHQLLAVQVLDGYLRAIGKVPDDLFDYDAALGPPADLMIEVTKHGGGEPVAKIVRRGDHGA